MSELRYGPKVRWLRQGARLTGRELCRRAAISPSYLTDIENGRRLPAPDVSDRIADALSIDRDALWRLALLERFSERDLRALAAPQPEPSEDQVRRDAITADQRWAQGYAAGRAAGLRAQPSAGGIDVGRLARAITANWTLVRKVAWADGGTPLDIARAIAAAYRTTTEDTP